MVWVAELPLFLGEWECGEGGYRIILAELTCIIYSAYSISMLLFIGYGFVDDYAIVLC